MFLMLTVMILLTSLIIHPVLHCIIAPLWLYLHNFLTCFVTIHIAILVFWPVYPSFVKNLLIHAWQLIGQLLLQAAQFTLTIIRLFFTWLRK